MILQDQRANPRRSIHKMFCAFEIPNMKTNQTYISSSPHQISINLHGFFFGKPNQTPHLLLLLKVYQASRINRVASLLLLPVPLHQQACQWLQAFQGLSNTCPSTQGDKSTKHTNLVIPPSMQCICLAIFLQCPCLFQQIIH